MVLDLTQTLASSPISHELMGIAKGCECSWDQIPIMLAELDSTNKASQWVYLSLTQQIIQKNIHSITKSEQKIAYNYIDQATFVALP